MIYIAPIDNTPAIGSKNFCNLMNKSVLGLPILIVEQLIFILVVVRRVSKGLAAYIKPREISPI
jgi:hypothetical protein